MLTVTDIILLDCNRISLLSDPLELQVNFDSRTSLERGEHPS